MELQGDGKNEFLNQQQILDIIPSKDGVRVGSATDAQAQQASDKGAGEQAGVPQDVLQANGAGAQEYFNIQLSPAGSRINEKKQEEEEAKLENAPLIAQKGFSKNKLSLKEQL